MLPSSKQVLPVTRTEDREKAGRVGSVLCPILAPTPTRQPGGPHPLPQGSFVLLTARLNLAVFQNLEHLDGMVHRRGQRLARWKYRREIPAHWTSRRQGLRELVSWYT